jgi:protein-S-isoprenylcysteine O-methyltransferase Ste14
MSEIKSQTLSGEAETSLAALRYPEPRIRNALKLHLFPFLATAVGVFTISLAAQKGANRMKPASRTRYAIREVLSLIGMGVALFWSAGRIDWWQAWAALAVMTVWSAATAFIVLRYNPDLLAERLAPRKGEKRWDTAIVALLGLITLVRYILAGLDQRYGWTGGLPLAAQLVALAVCALGNDVLFVWATAANPFFSRIVRIQSERGHAVVTDGPYHYVRHPAYTGAILYELAVPILLASWPALMVSGLSTLLLIIRTALEDRTLQAELTGYADYARQVRYRLVPGIW